METLGDSELNFWVNTGVVMGIFSFVEFFPNIYLCLFNHNILPTKTTILLLPKGENVWFYSSVML